MRKKKEYVVILALSIGRKSQKVIFLFLDRLGATKSVQKSMKNKTDFVLSDTVGPQILNTNFSMVYFHSVALGQCVHYL